MTSVAYHRCIAAACWLLLAPVAHAQEIPTYAPPPPIPADTQALPTIVLMSMGGTIASRGTPRLNITNYGGKGVPRVDPQDWVHDLPELAGIANVIIEDQRAPQDRTSSETHEDFARVAKRLNQLAADPRIAGIVVTHGTNTMAETAYYMNLTVNTDKPIVFVGSQRPWTGLSGDGPRNLYDAVRVAASPEARGKGVLHAMNQFINTARDVDKTSAYRVNTFKGVDVGAIGFADPDRVRFYREPVRRHTTQSEFAGKDYSSLPPVEVAYAYRDAPGYLIDAMVAHGAKGIVVEGTGAGSATSSQTEAIKRAQASGVVVVMTARTDGGRVQDTPRRREALIVPGDNLKPEKARILLQLALTQSSDLANVTRIFNEY
ncbi:L-asparaginase [Hydrocarboniphaga daqingensis]|uniref:L-asparaginase n=1 Tax=Hydrocarboniphaga daqingensis TaxID=490188 RepID=A0A1M5NZ46_9GAMM|nr:asparaginase [Hydrocarboniphaga daqingensis]SHG94844.1 L-asparaginase [Hydrocarboniphaga daqingensis]